jgi:PAB-dependent poly(A)-specific ribonuclease subunit 3
MYLDKRGPLIREAVMWSFATQLLSALRLIHASGMAARCVTPQRVLVSGSHRLRISGVGIVDVLEYDSKKSVQDAQADDMRALGRLLLMLACRSSSSVSNPRQALEFVSQQYSQELHSLIFSLVGAPVVKAQDVMSSLCMSGRLFAELDSLYSYADQLEAELAKEAGASRICRLLIKLGFINERPEFVMDRAWSETGDRYVLKLFRDFVFHQAGGAGLPVVDVAHVIESLMRLDVRDAEKVLLPSRDGQSLLVVSYEDVARCLEASFDELLQGSDATSQHGAPLSSASGGGAPRGGHSAHSSRSVR